MAKTPVTMKIDGYKDREVMMVYYEFEQETDVEGQMSGIPRGGKIIVRVKALNDGNAELLGWMLAPTDPRDFTLKFQSTVDGKDMKQLKGTGCYCVKYKEYWADGEEHYEDIELVCQKLENGPVAFENPWK